MDDAVITVEQRKAELSFAYVSALAAMAGYTCQRGPQPDMDTIDATVRAGGKKRPVLDVQLKATSEPDQQADGLHFRLKRKTYDDLRSRRTVPLVLVVLELPHSEVNWIDCTPERLIMRRCAWWDWLGDAGEISADSRTIVVPERQRFDMGALRGIVARIRDGRPIKELE